MGGASPDLAITGADLAEALTSLGRALGEALSKPNVTVVRAPSNPTEDSDRRAQHEALGESLKESIKAGFQEAVKQLFTAGPQHAQRAAVAIEPEYQRKAATFWQGQRLRILGHHGEALLTLHRGVLEDHFGPLPEDDPGAAHRILAALEEESRRDLTETGDPCTGVRFQLTADSPLDAFPELEFTPQHRDIFERCIDLAEAEGLRLPHNIHFAFVDAPEGYRISGTTTYGGRTVKVRVSIRARDRLKTLLHELHHVHDDFHSPGRYARKERDERAEAWAERVARPSLALPAPALAATNGHR